MSRPAAAVISGASRGIGLALAHEFAAHGHDLVMIARDAGRLEAAAAEVRKVHAVEVVTLAVDVASAEAPGRIAAAISGRGLEIGYLVNNAGAWLAGPLLEAEPQAVANLVAVNVVAQHALTRAIAPLIAGRGGGALMFVGSMAALVPTPSFACYGASKAFVHAMALALRQELKASTLTVSVLAPGLVATGFTGFTGDVADTRWGWLVELVASSPATVARAGYRGLVARTPIIVPGVLWRCLWLGMRCLPAGLVWRLAAWLLQPQRAMVAAADRATGR